jgi:hypothetical protein
LQVTGCKLHVSGCRVHPAAQIWDRLPIKNPNVCKIGKIVK